MIVRIIGCGSIGSALAQNLAENGKEVILFDKHPERSETLARAIQASVCVSPCDNLGLDEAILIAVKPQDFSTVAQELQGAFGNLVVSVMSGITTTQLKERLPHAAILRMMPNLAVRYGDGVVALAEDPSLNSYKSSIEQLFTSLGLIRWMPERLFNGIDALTGCGPAFIFALLESMVEASIAMGFSAEMGLDLIKHMVGGALTTLYESPESLEELKWKIAAPGGTTIAGLRTFEQKAVRSGIIETFLSSYKQAQELTKLDK